MKKIILTGGGTAGHITPNIALLPALKEAGFDIKYIGSSLLKRRLCQCSCGYGCGFFKDSCYHT